MRKVQPVQKCQRGNVLLCTKNTSWEKKIAVSTNIPVRKVQSVQKNASEEIPVSTKNTSWKISISTDTPVRKESSQFKHHTSKKGPVSTKVTVKV